MECREAIDILKEHIDELYIGEVDLIKALREFAIPAMEKEIARDVAIEVGISRREYYACPNCMGFIKWRFDPNRDNYEPGICTCCGQSLKWR